MAILGNSVFQEPWNKAKIVGQKAPFKVKDIWALCVRLEMERQVRELALFNLGIDIKLRVCNLVALKVRDVSNGSQVATRAVVMRHKTKRQVHFEITGVAREALQGRILGHWVDELGLDRSDCGISTHEGPSSGSAAARSLQPGIYREVSRSRRKSEGIIRGGRGFSTRVVAFDGSHLRFLRGVAFPNTEDMVIGPEFLLRRVNA